MSETPIKLSKQLTIRFARKKNWQKRNKAKHNCFDGFCEYKYCVVDWSIITELQIQNILKKCQWLYIPKWLLFIFSTVSKGLFTWTRHSELPRGNDCPGARVTSRSHDGLLSRGNVVPGQRCPGSTSLPRGKFIVIWPLLNYLNSFSFYTNCYREIILNIFTYFWCFLEFLGENLSQTLLMSMRKTTLAPG